MEPKTHFGVKMTKILLTMVLIVGVSLIAGLMMQFGIQKYAEIMQQNRIHTMITELQAQYRQARWQENKLEEIGQRGLDTGLILELRDETGKIILDGNALAARNRQDLMSDISGKMQLLMPGWRGKQTARDIELFDAGKSVGTLTITYLEPYFLTEGELITLTHVYGLLLIVLVNFVVLLMYLFWLKRNSLLRDLANLDQLAKKIVNNQPVTDPLFVSGSMEINEVLTSINQVAEQMAEQERDKGRITDDLAHELRTPLTTLQANLEMMAEGMVEPSGERLHSCHEETLRIIRLVGELEQLNKYETASMKLSLEEFDLGELLQSIFLNFEGAFRQKDVQLHFQGGPELMTGDRDKLSQLMVNLLSNSLKHTPPGGQVLILVNGNQDFIHIVVNDNGVGIPQADLPRVFHRLYRADTSRNRATGGAGIGLTIAKAIVQAHRGSIDIVSQLGTGTEVTVVLPRKN